jgi:hypothetical protein
MIGETCLPLDSDQWASMPTDSNAEFYEFKSSFWSIKRHKWIKGPNLPKEIGQLEIGNTIMPTEAIFVMENIDENDDVLEMSGGERGVKKCAEKKSCSWENST